MLDTTRKDICIHGHYECFARSRNGVCNALSDTDFGNRDCPFYKTDKQIEEEDRRNRDREGE